jgi:hypothetical protein
MKLRCAAIFVREIVAFAANGRACAENVIAANT